jgi:hypothetical protein
LPMPDAAPVTIATLPASLAMGALIATAVPS